MYTHTHIYKFACQLSTYAGIILLRAYTDTIYIAPPSCQPHWQFCGTHRMTSGLRWLQGALGRCYDNHLGAVPSSARRLAIQASGWFRVF